MDFAWTKEQADLKRGVVKFAQQELGHGILERDHHGCFPREEWQKCADFGIQGIAFPEEYGGSNHDVITSMLLMEGLGYGCRDNGLLFSLNAQMWSVQTPIAQFGSELQRCQYLPPLLAGRSIGAHGMSEPGSGSDTFSLQTSAVRDGDDYILNGSKTFTTNAPVADLFLIFATVNRAHGFMGLTAFLVEGHTPGLVVGKPIEKMGLRTSPMSEVYLDGCRVAAGCRLGKEGQGGLIFDHSMQWERSCILASAIGSMERQLEECTRYARTRKQFGKTIGSFQSVANRVVDMKLRLETARLLLYKAGWLRAQGQRADQETAMAKLYISECYVASGLDAVQIFGGYGYTAEFGHERDLRDAVGSRLYSGTSEIQRHLIAKSMGLG